MKTIKLIIACAVLALISSSCTVTFLPPVAGGAGVGGCGNIRGYASGCQSGLQGRPYGQPGFQPGFQGRPGPGFHTPSGQQYGSVARHPSGYPLRFQPGSQIPADVSANPSSRYYAGKYIVDSGTYNSDRPGLNYTSGGKTVHVRN